MTDYDAQRTFQKLARIAAAVDSGKANLRMDIRIEDFWDTKTGSTSRRLSRLTRNTGIRRFMGINDGAIDIESLMTEGNIILVNLGQSRDLSREAAKIFASLFVLEFFETALQRSNRASYQGDEPPMFLLYLDEFQNYINEDIAESLDQALKGGLHMVLAHQHLGQFQDNDRLADSVFTNARIRAVFGGLKPESAEVFANMMFMDDLTKRQVVKAFRTIIHLYEKQYETTRSRTTSLGRAHADGSSWGKGKSNAYASASGRGETSGRSLVQPMMSGGIPMESWSETDTAGLSSFSSDMFSGSGMEFEGNSSVDAESQSESEGETIFPVWVPQPQEIVTHEEVMSLDEKRLKIVHMLHTQMQQHCFLKLDTETTQPMWVPFVSHHKFPAEMIAEYEDMVYRRQGSLKAEEVDLLIKQNEQHFLARALGKPHAAPQPTTIDIDAEPPDTEPAAAESSATAPPNPPSDTDDDFYYT